MTLRELTMHDEPLAAYRRTAAYDDGQHPRAVNMRRTSAAQAAPAPITDAAPDSTAPADAPLDCRP